MMLGYWVSESTVARYMLKRRGRPTQNWKTFIRNHLGETAAIDFLTVPTIMFRTVYVFVVLSLDRRRIIHFNVTTRPTAEWTALQLIQAFPFDSRRATSSVTATASTATRCATRCRECLNHMIVLTEGHARRILKSYLEYYHGSRTHLGLDKDTPDGRAVEPPERGQVLRRAMVGGLHNRYYRDAA